MSEKCRLTDRKGVGVTGGAGCLAVDGPGWADWGVGGKP